MYVVCLAIQFATRPSTTPTNTFNGLSPLSAQGNDHYVSYVSLLFITYKCYSWAIKNSDPPAINRNLLQVSQNSSPAVLRWLMRWLECYKNRTQNFNIHLATQQQNHPPKSPSWDLTSTRLSTICTVCLVQPCPACSWSIGSCHSPSLLFACDDVKESPSGLLHSGLGTTKNSQDWAAWLIQYLTNQKKHIQSKTTPRQLEAKGPRGREQRL